jgi:hypothetical protein
MTIVGCDFHPSWQQIALLDTEAGEVRECKIVNGNGEAERFYRQLPSPALIGVQACRNSQWLVDTLQGLEHEVDWRSGPNSSQLRAQAEDGPARCGPHSEVVDGILAPSKVMRLAVLTAPIGGSNITSYVNMA